VATSESELCRLHPGDLAAPVFRLTSEYGMPGVQRSAARHSQPANQSAEQRSAASRSTEGQRASRLPNIAGTNRVHMVPLPSTIGHLDPMPPVGDRNAGDRRSPSASALYRKSLSPPERWYAASSPPSTRMVVSKRLTSRSCNPTARGAEAPSQEGFDPSQRCAKRKLGETTQKLRDRTG
jgi:hypothetical protein